MLCGTDPLPELFRAKRYKIHQKFLTKADFQLIMRNLPVQVAEEDIEDMFAVADTDNDGKLGYKVLLLQLNLKFAQIRPKGNGKKPGHPQR